MVYKKKIKDEALESVTNGTIPKVHVTAIPTMPTDLDNITISKKEWEEVHKQLKMLNAVADQGRKFNYENANAEKKPIKVKLSIYNGNIIVGWRMVRDDLVKHPTTGKTVGEQHESELMLLGKDDKGEYNVSSKVLLNSFQSFSDAHYNERIECEVVSRREDYGGKIDFDVLLPDGQIITINSRFVN